MCREHDEKSEIYLTNLDLLFDYKIHSTYYPYTIEAKIEENKKAKRMKEILPTDDPDEEFTGRIIMSPTYHKKYGSSDFRVGKNSGFLAKLG